jgi:sugar transferase (PEP-CTERM/EpsH1 system associated)
MSRICHLVYSFGIGGLEKLILEMVRDSQQHFEHHIIALTRAEPSMIEMLPANVHLYQLNKPEGHSFSIYPALYRQLKAIQPDTLHSYNLATVEYQWLAALLRIPRRIHAEHGRDSYDPDGSNNKYQLLRKLCSPVVHKFVAVSNDLGKWLNDEVGLASTKIQVVHNGIDTQHFCVDKKQRSPKFTLGHVARMQSIKNQTMLLDAYSRACQDNSEFSQNSRLLLVGDGPELSSLKQHQQRLPPLGEVIFAGAQMDVKPYYQSFDLFILSSIAEGIPVTLLEAMSMKIAPIVTNVGGIKEVINHQFNGVLVESNDTQQLSNEILALYDDPLSRARIAKHAREHVEQSYSKQQMLSQYYRLYEAS